MSFDYSKLKGKIIEEFQTLGAFAKAMEWSERTNGLKLNGNVQWKQDEMMKAGKLLGLKPNDFDEYFFNIKVQSIEPNQ